MSDTAEAGRIPPMAPDKAQDIARGLTWLPRCYAESDSQWWLAYSISLAQTQPTTKP